MPVVYARCPNCKVTIAIYNTHESGVCSYCGASYLTDVALKTYFAGKFGGKDPKSNISNKENELFMRGCSHMALGEFEKASAVFLRVSALSPANPRYWLYLLSALTEKFRYVYRIFCENAEVDVGSHKVVCKNVYHNFISTAESSDFAEAREEMGIDLTPDNKELCERVICDILSAKRIKSKAAEYEEAAYYALTKIKEKSPSLSEKYREKLLKKFCPESDGVLEINSLLFFADTGESGLSVFCGAESIEFRSDVMAGADRFDCLELTPGIRSIGPEFPLKCLKSSYDIPDRLMYGCGGLVKVVLRESVRNIGTDAFNNCVSLGEIKIPEGITAIGDRAFLGTAVKFAKIPSSVIFLGNEVFGVKSGEAEEVDISKYLFRISHPLERKYPDWNKVGIKRAGYILEEEEGLTLYYPENLRLGEDGKKIKVPLSENEKRLFTALAVSMLDGETLGKKKAQSGGFFSRLFKKDK